MSILERMRSHLVFVKQDKERRAKNLALEQKEADESCRFFSEWDKKTEEGKYIADILELMFQKGCLTKEQKEQYISLIPSPDKTLAFFFIKDVFKEIGNPNYKFIDATCQVLRDTPLGIRDMNVDFNDYPDENDDSRLVSMVLHNIGGLDKADIRYTVRNHDYIICLDWNKVLAKSKQVLNKQIENEDKKLADFEKENKEDLEFYDMMKRVKEIKHKHINNLVFHQAKTDKLRIWLKSIEQAELEMNDK